MSESIALIVKSLEVIMEKYGYWRGGPTCLNN